MMKSMKQNHLKSQPMPKEYWKWKNNFTFLPIILSKILFLILSYIEFQWYWLILERYSFNNAQIRHKDAQYVRLR